MTGWSGFTASRIGSAHLRREAPNQDAHDVGVGPYATVVVVADGHGHRTHFRSGTGSQLAVRAVLAATADLGPGDTAAPALGDYLASRAADVVARWQQLVADDLAARPFAGDEAPWVGTAEADPVLAYGSTLVAMVGTPGSLGLLQLGDGDAVVAWADGEVTRPLPVDPLLAGSRTTSLCQPDPLASVRTVALDVVARPVTLAFVATDGFGAPRVDGQGWWRQTGEELAGHLREHGLDWVRERLPQWLDEPAEVGGDDTTVGVLAAVGEPGDAAGAQPFQ